MRWCRATLVLGALALPGAAPPALGAGTAADSALQFEVSLAPPVSRSIEQGRLLVFISRARSGEPRLVDSSLFYNNEPQPRRSLPVLLGTDVSHVDAHHAARLDGSCASYPIEALADLPAAEYLVQAVLVPYTRFARADGHVIYAHADHGEGQDVLSAPGNLVSEPLLARLDPHAHATIRLQLSKVVEPVPPRTDSTFVRHLHLRSDRASSFWGVPMDVGLAIALPAGYDEHPGRRYIVVFHQGHFGEGAGFSALEPPASVRGADAQAAWSAASKQFRQAWVNGTAPEVIIVTLQHATPYYDTSYFMNSANTGPWGDVFVEEVIPFIDSHFRTIPKPYARILAGLSSGGGIAAYLQVHYPDTFGGAWIFAPDPVDFHDFYTVDLYGDPNAYRVPGYEWNIAPPRCEFRSTQGQCWQTVRNLTRYFDVLGSHGRSGQWLDNYDALYGPVGSDGYPVPVWNHSTGEIDHAIVEYWRAHGADLRAYLEARWAQLAPRLKDKLHFAAGDADNFFLNNGLYRMQEFLARTPPPAIDATFQFGHPGIGHTFVGVGYDPFPLAMLQDMARRVRAHAPSEDRKYFTPER